jgi:Meiotically up-regulated gene 113
MGYAYLFLNTSNGEHKIGATGSDDVEVRLNQLKTGNPYLKLSRKFETMYPFDVERKMMRAFESKRTRLDFFALDDADLLTIDQIVHDAETSLTLEKSILSLKNRQDNGILLDPNEAYRQDVAELREVRAKIDSLKCREVELEARLKSAIGIYRGIRTLVSWKTNEKPHPWFDRKQLKADEPDIYAAYLRFQFRRMFRLEIE